MTGLLKYSISFSAQTLTIRVLVAHKNTRQIIFLIIINNNSNDPLSIDISKRTINFNQGLYSNGSLVAPDSGRIYEALTEDRMTIVVAVVCQARMQAPHGRLTGVPCGDGAREGVHRFLRGLNASRCRDKP